MIHGNNDWQVINLEGEEINYQTETMLPDVITEYALTDRSYYQGIYAMLISGTP